MNIDKTKLKIGVWYEDENGDMIPSMDDSPEPVTKVGAITYHSCFPLQITESIYMFHDDNEKRNCRHQRKYHKKDMDLVKGYKGRTCRKCVCSQVRKWWQPWGSKWDEGTSVTPLMDLHSTIGGGNQNVILAMANSGDFTLAEALVVFASSCERCMNVLAYKYTGGKDGYEEYSEEWKKCGTVCGFCEGEEHE